MKRVLSLFLSCIFVLGVCFSTPIIASAAEDDLILKLGEATTAYEPYIFKELTAPGSGEDEKGTCALVGYTGNDKVNIESADINSDKGFYILTKIASTAFPNGIKNTTLTIPANITSIEDGAFVGCTALTAFEVSDKSQYFTVDNGVLFNKNKTTLIAYPAAKEGTEYTIPATVTEIAEGAFANCSGLLGFKVTEGNLNFYVDPLENSVEEGAVIDCGVLIEKVTGENEVTTKRIIAYPAANPTTKYTIPADVTEIADGAFANCNSINAFSVSADTYFSTTEDGILFNANKTKLIAYPAGKTDVTTYTIPATVTEIADGAFSGCKSLKTITVAEGNTAFSATEDGVLFNQEGTKLIAYPAAKTGTEYTIPEGVEEIADGAFADCANLKYIFTEKTSFEEITIGVNNNIFSQPGVYHKGMTGHDFSGEEGSKKCTVCCLLEDGTGEQHTWENGVCTECGLVEHVHSWTFDVVDGEGNENKIKATCEGAGSCIYQTEGVTITLEAQQNLVYTGVAIENPVVFSFPEDLDQTTKAGLEELLKDKRFEYIFPTEDETVKNAGVYTASVTVGGKTATLPFEITAKPLTGNDVTIMVANESCEYTGSAIEPKVTVALKDDETALALGTDYTVEYSNNTDVGTATVTITFKGNYSGTATATFEIVAQHFHSWSFDVVEDENGNKISATCTGSNCIYHETGEIFSLIINSNENLVYDNNVKNNPVNIDYSANAQNVFDEEFLNKLSVSYSYNGEPCTVKNAGIYTATLVMGEGEKSATITKTFEITPKIVNVTLKDSSGTYDGSDHVFELIFDDSSLVKNSDYYVSCTEDTINVGEIYVTVELSNPNYVFGFEEDETPKRTTKLPYEIKPKQVSEIDVVLESNDYTYTGVAFEPAITVKINGEETALASKEYQVKYSDNVNAGEATVTVTLSDNYISTNAESSKVIAIAKFTIDKATPDVKKFAFTAPENLTYDGNEKTATVVVKDGITGMGAITIKYYGANEALLTETPKAEGTYTVKINVTEGTNFVAATEITSDDWKFTIKAHEHDWKYTASGAVITATCQNNGCDIETTTVELVAPENLVYDGTKKSVTVKAPHADLLSKYTLSHATGADVGTYTAYLSIGEGDKVVTVQKSFTITPALIVVTKVTAIDRAYDGNLVVSINKTDGIVYTGLIDDDKVGFDLSALTGTLSDANVGSNKTVKVNGSIVLTGEDAKNYDVSTPGVTNVNITPATLTVTPNAKSSEQYYSLPALDYKVTGLIGSDKLTKEPTLTTNADIKKVGNYTITASGAEASTNYKITYAPATLTVTEHKNHKVATDGWKVTVPGTCMVVGKEAGTCTLCSGTVTRDSKIDPNNHALITTVTKKETCTQNGEALVTCANGCSYSLKTTLPADGELHNFAEDFTVIESTCVAKGSKYKVCQNPGCKVVSEKTEIAINPDAHKNIVTINAKEATCEEKGYTGDEFCNDCKKIIDPGIEINAKGHTESDWIVDKEPTFTEEGAKHTACTVCKKELKKEVIAKRALEVPEVKIENASNGIKVSWSQDEDATGYTVYSSTYNATTKKWSAWKNRGTAAATKSSWTDKTVSEGVTYRYTVRSVNGTNKSNYKATSGLCYVVAPKVTVSITSTGLLAKWNKVNNATSYIVYRRALVNGVWSSWVNLGSTKAEKNTWSDTSVQSGVTYRYTVRAVVGKVKSGYTSSSSIIYLAQPLLKISNANTGITGKWDPIAGATGYTIYRSEYNPSTKKWSKWLTLGTTGATAKTFTDKTVKSGYEYKYTIRAVSGKFKSTYQDSNKLVYLAQPTLKISNVANGIQGKWSQVNGATGYIIYRRELKDGKWSNWTSLGTTKSTAKTFTDKTVKSGVTYKYTIRAKNGSYKSSYVSTGSLVFLSVPTVKISNGITGVNVSWSKIEGATSYLVYRRELVDGKWTKWAEFKTVSETSLVDETVKSGTNYRYTVRALNGKSRSMYTSTGTLYYLTAPTVTVEKVDAVVKVNWTQTVGAKGYTIYRAELGVDGKWSKWVTLGTATEKYSSCKDKTAKTGVTYKYTVRAVNGKVKSAYVDGAQITNQ